jgi:hypothetical protein
MILESSKSLQDDYWWSISDAKTRREYLEMYEELSFRETVNNHLLHMVENDEIKTIEDLYDLYDDYADIIHGREHTSEVVGDEMLTIISYIIEGIAYDELIYD